MSRIVDEHRLYLRDRARVSAYERALRALVSPGAVVVDLASGTGILGMLACRAGASRVYAIEEDAIAGLAADIAHANGLDDRIVPVRGHSTRVPLPERADLVVSDQIGRFGLESGIVDLFADARARFLRPGGILMPSRIDLICAPIEHGRMHRRVEFWARPRAGFDMSSAHEIAANTGYPVRLAPDSLLGPPAMLASVDLSADVRLPIRGAADLRVGRAGVLHGIGGWFDATLAPEETLTNSPLSPKRIRRRQVFFPVSEVISVASGDAVRVAFNMLPGESLYTWDVVVEGRAGPARRARGSTFRGMLLSHEDLRSTHPERRPQLTPHGRARLTVLELCDGGRPLHEIEAGVFGRHRELFATPEQAAVFVAEVVSRYALPED